MLSEAQTGRFMLGVAVNSDAGLVGQILLDEQNFDWRACQRVGTIFSTAAPGAEPVSDSASKRPRYRSAALLGQLHGAVLDGYAGQPWPERFVLHRRYRDWDEQRSAAAFRSVISGSRTTVSAIRTAARREDHNLRPHAAAS